MFKNIIYLIISILILFPYPFHINIMEFPFFTSHILMLLVCMFLPVALIKKNYWTLPFTKLMWAMRLIFLAIFLIASFKYGLSTSRIVAFIGYFMINFLYEIPFIINIETNKFFNVFNATFLFTLTYATIVIVYFGILQGSLQHSMPSVRGFLILYPNHFAILLILIFWIRQYFIEKHSRIVDIWIIILIFISFSRTAIATFLVSYIVNTLVSFNINKLKKYLAFLLVLSLLIPATLYFLELKEQSGATLGRSYHSRVNRWEVALEHIKQNFIIGAGFERTNTVISNYRSISGQQAKLGSMHNDYIDLLVKGGMLGFLSFFAVLIGIFILGVKYNKSLVVLVLTIALTAFFQNPFKNINIMFCLFFTVGAIMFNVSYYNGPKKLDTKIEGLSLKNNEKTI